jgi:glycosyltransferase involved in cell wall biosynthesis
MRILHVIPQFHYFGGRTIVGGHASCLLTLALAQQRDGHDVAIVSYTAGCAESITIEGGPVVHSLFERAKTRTIRYGLQFCHAAAKWVRARANEFDVIHAHSGHADYFLVSQRLKAVAGLPTAHTMYCPIPPTGRTRLPLVHGAIRRWANRLDWIGGISENVQSSMIDFGMKRAEFIRPPLDVERFGGSEGESARREMGLSRDDLVVLFVGNATRQKNMHGVLHAVHRLRDEFPKLTLIVTTELKHSSSDTDMAKLAAEINDLNLASCVVQKGIVDNMPALMQACDVLVAPFLDSYGPSDYFMAALEAMAAGRPVVVSNVGGMREIISDAVGTLVDPQNHDAIAAGLRAYLADQPLRDRVGANARDFVQREFHPQAIVKAYDEVYRRITT